jgi:hypothetical protein
MLPAEIIAYSADIICLQVRERHVNIEINPTPSFVLLGGRPTGRIFAGCPESGIQTRLHVWSGKTARMHGFIQGRLI